MPEQTETKFNPGELITITNELRSSLARAYSEQGNSNFVPMQPIDIVHEVITKLPTGSRFVVRAVRMAALPIMGWLADQAGGTITQRGGLNEPQHTFGGTDFVFDSEGFLVLLAGTEASSPWCRLAFSHTTGEAGFQLAILPPGLTTNHAEFI